MEKITQLGKGLAGIGSIQLLEITNIPGAEAQDLIKTITQVVLGIVTIWMMLKKTKKKEG